jgi:hypothetical protein
MATTSRSKRSVDDFRLRKFSSTRW